MSVGEYILRAERHLASAKAQDARADDELVALDLKLVIDACTAALARLATPETKEAPAYDR